MHKNTLVTTVGLNKKEYKGAINPPIYNLSTILFPTLKDYYNATQGNSIYNQLNNYHNYSYGTCDNATVYDLAQAISLLEGEDCNTLLYPSGLAALTFSILTVCKTGDHVLISDNAYNPFKKFIDTLSRMNIEVSFYDPIQDIRQYIRKNTTLIMIEAPGSVTFEIPDIKNIVTAAKKNNIITIMDNSWATPLYCQPLKHGVDVSLCSATKYFSGHSDVIMGAITTSNTSLFRKFCNVYERHGLCMSAQSCYLVQRGMRTMAVRLTRHRDTVQQVAKWLEKHPLVQRVLCPALSSFAQYELWQEYFSGVTGLFSIVLNKRYSFEQISYMIDNMRLFGIGASWGGYMSLILPFEIGKIRTITKDNYYDGNYIRIYCGLEEAEDLIEDLHNALTRLEEYA